MAKKQKCYLYTRVSTQIQVEGFSLDAQRERLLKEAKHRDMEVAEEFSDEGKSGKNTTGRPAFQEMMSRIQAGNPDGVSYVYVFKLSRFGRNTADVLNSLQIMEDCGVNLLSVDDGIDSAGAAGKLMVAVLAAVAEIERENIKAQTIAGRIQKAREGGWNGGQAPLGYKIENGRLAADEDEAKLVRLIFKKYAYTDMGYSGVARWLNSNGYRRNVRQNGRYDVLTDFAVKTVLDNPVYTGKIVHGRFGTEKIQGARNEYRRVVNDQYEIYDGEHEAIVSDELWEAVRAKRQAVSGRSQIHYGPKHIHVLSGIIKCPVCGRPMYGNVSQAKKKDGSGKYPPKFYYVCKNSRRANGRDCTYRRSIREEVLDEQVIRVAQQAVNSMFVQKGLIMSLFKQDDLEELTANLEALKAARKKAEQKRSRLLGKISGLDPDDDQYDAMYDGLQGILRQHSQSVAELDDQIEQAADKLRSAKGKEKSFEQVVPAIADWPPERQRELMHNILERIDIYPEPLPDGSIIKSIQFRSPTSTGEVTDTDYHRNDDKTCDGTSLDSGRP